jgi:enoyl-CoA hydratase
MGRALSDEILSENHDGVLILTINRPHRRNALDTATAEALAASLRRLDQDTSLRVGVLTGAGAAFCSGVDLKAFRTEGTPKGLMSVYRSATKKPLIAAVEGSALAGGLELALTCDLIVAGRGATFGLPEVRVGLCAAGGTFFRLRRWVSYGVAMEMVLGGEAIDAGRAYQSGLVTHLVPDGEALGKARSIAARIAANAPFAVAVSKNLVRDTYGHAEDDCWLRQKELTQEVWRRSDAIEGARAFSEKRLPIWDDNYL